MFIIYTHLIQSLFIFKKSLAQRTVLLGEKKSTLKNIYELIDQKSLKNKKPYKLIRQDVVCLFYANRPRILMCVCAYACVCVCLVETHKDCRCALKL